MSLEGNLTDLGLGEILQIVNLSKKTGILSLSSREEKGAIFFRLGQVVRATSSSCQQTLGEVLMQKGVIDPVVLRKAISFQEENGFSERLGVILVKNFGVSSDVIEEVVCEQIENVVFSLFAWTEGSFQFEVKNNIETVDDIKIDPLQFMLDQGLNPQFLAMEGTRIQDEKIHADKMGFADNDSPEVDDDFAFDLAGEPGSATSSTTSEVQQIVIVDDDGPTLKALSDGLAEKGFAVHPLTRSEDALIKVDSLYRSGEQPTVLIDLIMPKMDGSGVLGGIELLDLLHNNFEDMRFLVMTDYNNEDAEKKVREMGYSFILKPRRVEINTPAILQDFLSLLLHDIGTSTVRKGA
jgi:CheY-like chemotaxis protein